MMQRIAVVIYGPPGSGKSTQADLIAARYGLVRFDVGKYIEAVIYDPTDRRNALIARQRKLYERGLLCETSWVYRIVAAHLRKIIRAGYGVVLSGAPREAPQAFDHGKRRGIYTILRRGYGKKNIATFLLAVGPRHSIKRNTHRKICKVCGRQYLYRAGTRFRRCPFCDAPLRTRKDDAPRVIRERLLEYARRTLPILKGLRERKYTVHTINGELAPYLVFQRIARWLS